MRSQSDDEPIEPPRKNSAVLPESLIEGMDEEQKSQLVALMAAIHPQAEPGS